MTKPRSLLIVSLLFCVATTSASPFRRYDSYGTVRWKDEKARLDNFAIQILNSETGLGYILVVQESGGCPGEAMARAQRAKRYLTEHRGVPWNRVVWRLEGFREEIETTLLITSDLPFDTKKNAGRVIAFPLFDSTMPAVEGPETRACRATLAQIRKSRW